MKARIIILGAALILGAGISSADTNGTRARISAPAYTPDGNGGPVITRMFRGLGPNTMQNMFRAYSPVVDDSGYGYVRGGALVEERPE